MNMRYLFVIFCSMLSATMHAQTADSLAQNSEEILEGGSVDVKPEFPGGNAEFYKFIAKNYILPEIEGGMRGRVDATFVIEKDGTISNIKIIKDMGFGTGEEAIRVIQKSPKWKPAEQNGRKVRAMFHIPIMLNIQD